MKASIGLGAMLLACAGPVCANVAYAPFGRADRIRQGSGGEHFARHGIEWWTSGAPARRFEVVGLVTDDRVRLALSGSAVGSARIARMVRGHGADAVLLHDADQVPTCLPGQEYSCRHGRVRGRGIPVTTAITHMIASR